MASSPGSPSRRSRSRSNTIFEVTTKDLLCVFLTLSFGLVAYNTVGSITQSQNHYIASGSKLRHHTEEIVSHLEQIRTLTDVENGNKAIVQHAWMVLLLATKELGRRSVAKL